MRQIMLIQAINEALREELLRDENVFLIGEDLHTGTFGQTKGIFEEFGPERVVSTPISEAGFTGISTGAAMAGLRPVVEYMVSNFMYVAMDQLVNQVGKLRYMYGGQIKLPIVFKALNMGGGAAAQHSDNSADYFLHAVGFKVVMPSTPYDAKGLLKSAIRDDNPVIFYEEFKTFMAKGEIPDEDYVVPIGKGDIKKEGKDVTIVAAGYPRLLASSVAEKLEKEGISVEVVDARSLYPIDEDLILQSVKKTGRLVTLDDAPINGSFASEIAALVAEKGYSYLKAPIKRVTRIKVPVPHSKIMEDYVLLNEAKVINAVKEVVNY